MSEYADTQYWEKRYCRKTAQHEWLLNVNAAIDNGTILPQLALIWDSLPGRSILHLGCGTSLLSFPPGVSTVTHVDQSASAIAFQRTHRRKYLDSKAPSAPITSSDGNSEGQADELYSDVNYVDEDALAFLARQADNSWDVVVEKAFTDSLMCDVDVGFNRLSQVMREIHRVLKPDGIYVSFSCAPPLVRMPYLEAIFASTNSLNPIGNRHTPKSENDDENQDNKMFHYDLLTSPLETSGADQHTEAFVYIVRGVPVIATVETCEMISEQTICALSAVHDRDRSEEFDCH